MVRNFGNYSFKLPLLNSRDFPLVSLMEGYHPPGALGARLLEFMSSLKKKTANET